MQQRVFHLGEAVAGLLLSFLSPPLPPHTPRPPLVSVPPIKMSISAGDEQKRLPVHQTIPLIPLSSLTVVPRFMGFVFLWTRLLLRPSNNCDCLLSSAR
ncbi:hypothetical protein CDAR_177051 [Caerostris darwini]|uniref:Secreted protein n=1 Tax=Caerostris darwini TaxID=1538125 RepID=A0AAV4UBD7_9ARAC|nr:hypothetical protein CDAR_177051 [Caerostris darwini]